MPEIENEIEKVEMVKDKLGARYSKLSKVFIFITILFIIWVVIIALRIYLFELDYNWALLSLNNWVYACCLLIGFFIILEVFFYLHYNIARDKRLIQEKTKPQFYRGKRLYLYTQPKDTEGGIYSKTYIKIDENSVLRLRTLMVPPGALRGKKEK
jgi:hypothetical protein